MRAGREQRLALLDNLTPRLPLHRFPAHSLPGLLVHTARRVPQRTFLRFFDPAVPTAPPREVTFAGFRELVARAAAFLERAGVRPGDRVLLLAENSPEWQAVAFATQLLRAEPTALFSSLAAGPAEELARRVRPRVLLVSTLEQWQKLASAAPDLAREGLAAVLSTVALPDPPGEQSTTLATALGDGAPALDLADLEARAAAVGEEGPFLLLFTSGTTGRQKGVRLAQRAIVHAIEAGVVGTGMAESDLGVHLLPFGHVAGHDQFALALAQGHTLAMIARREDVPRALALGPTYLFAVPLIYERIRNQSLEKLDHLPASLRCLLVGALEAAARVRVDGSRGAGDRLLTWLADALVGRKVRAALGGRIRGVFAGGAPASEALFRFFEGLGIPLVELYGMTEVAGMITSNLLSGPRRALVAGLVTPDHEVRIADDGELQLRGPLLLSGFLEPSDAEGAFTEDGFFRTGDLAWMDDAGWLRVTGRKKHIMVLSTGKKLAPEPLETTLASAAPFRGAVLLGEGRPFVSAAVFVAREELARLASLGLDAATELLPRARAVLSAFSEYEKPRRLLVVPGEPQDYPGLVTPTLKLKREALLAFLGPAVAQIYAPA
jgi:long-chain acyl-CoA synthetase